MNVDFKKFFERHAWNIILIACFLIGQFYLIEYRLSEQEEKSDDNKDDLISLVSKNARAIEANRQRIHTIEIGRASDMGELRAMLKGLTGQVERLEDLSNEQYRTLQQYLNEKD